MKIIPVIFFSTLFCHSLSYSADFSYQINNPSAANADDYIVNTNNAELKEEGDVIYWKQDIGAKTLEESNPGVITYHFSFEQSIADATLFIRTSTFHWSYSKGHSYVYTSTDGSNWIKLLEATPPEYGDATTKAYNDKLPANFIGAKDIWLRVELNAYGENASRGGAMTNTAQHSRYDSNANNTTLSLQVNYSQNHTAIPQTVENISGNPLVASSISADTIQGSVPANNAIVTDGDDQVTVVDEFNNKVNIKPNSLVTQHPVQKIDLQSGKKTTLLRGSIEVTIPTSSNDYLIDTPLGQIIVSGSTSNSRESTTATQFSADYTQSGSIGSININVTSGSVKVVDREGNSKILTAGEELKFNGSINRSNWVLPIDGDFIYGGLENTLSWLAYPNATGYILEYNFPTPNFFEENPSIPEYRNKSIYFSSADYTIWQDLVILPMMIPDLPGSIVEARIFPIDENGNVLNHSVGCDKGTFTFK